MGAAVVFPADIAQHGDAIAGNLRSYALPRLVPVLFAAIGAFFLGRHWDRREYALRHQSLTDGLTGVYNSAAYRQTLDEGIPGHTIGVIYWDVDGLKAVNDKYGHAAGDRLLRRIADSVRAVAGPEDPILRVGGDEFVLVIPDADMDSLRARLTQWSLILNRLNQDAPPPLSASAGLALGPGKALEELIQCADTQMYKNKP